MYALFNIRNFWYTDIHEGFCLQFAFSSVHTGHVYCIIKRIYTQSNRGSGIANDHFLNNKKSIKFIHFVLNTEDKNTVIVSSSHILSIQKMMFLFIS